MVLWTMSCMGVIEGLINPWMGMENLCLQNHALVFLYVMYVLVTERTSRVTGST